MDAHAPSFSSLRLSPRWLLGALLVFFVGLSVQYAVKASKGEHRSAILRWREQILSLHEGEDIYDTFHYPNPPIMALILTPVAALPEWTGLPPLACALVWFYLKVGMALLALLWVFRMVEEPGRPFPLWAKVLTVLLSLRPIAGDLSHGNVNLFILFLVVGFLYAFHRRRDFLAGVSLALGIACKVTPALFVPYLAWKRSWKALAGCTVGMALFFWPGFVPAAFLGWQENLDQVNSWMDQMVKPYVIQGVVTSEHHNQSLPGLIYRLFTHSPSFVAYPNNMCTGVRWDNLLNLSHDTARWLVKGFMGLFVLLIVWTCRTPREGPRTSNPRLAAEFSLVVLGMLLFSERTWKHHCVTLLLPFAVLSYYLAIRWTHRAVRLYLIGSLVAVVLLMSSTSISLLGRDTGKLAQVYGAYVFAFLVLLAALAILLRQQPAETCTAGWAKDPDGHDCQEDCPAVRRRAG
jgi:alpha-1,2-mannosyltransferase